MVFFRDEKHNSKVNLLNVQDKFWIKGAMCNKFLKKNFKKVVIHLF